MLYTSNTFLDYKLRCIDILSKFLQITVIIPWSFKLVESVCDYFVQSQLFWNKMHDGGRSRAQFFSLIKHREDRIHFLNDKNKSVNTRLCIVLTRLAELATMMCNTIIKKLASVD
uniref:Uncharacterized protein n=1 Tax=Cacopsylla melanoneura TaxID=428564 RepID=A0A8D8YCX3_9HEMI